MNKRKPPLVSVIMPVYNVEEFLAKCIESVLDQTLTDLELFVIDDGSTDSSGKICDQYAKKDRRVKVIHKENGGAPTARNAAIDQATGEYMYFIDSDDWIEKDYLEKMYQLAKKYHADLVVTGFLMEYYQNGKFVTYSTSCKDAIYKSQSDFRKNAYKYFNNSLLSLAWNKLMRREIIAKNNLRFPDTKWDDHHFNMEFLMDVNVVVVSSMAKYHWYRSRKGAETMINYSDPNMFKKRVEHYEHVLKLYKHWGLENDSKSIDAIDSYFIGRVFQCIQELADNKDLNRKEKRKKIKSILNDKYTRKALKTAKSLSFKFKILVLPMKLKNVTLCLLFGNVINFVRTHFKALFIKLKEKEVHG